ncbi:MAG: branched-chain amino acid ABC transporter substrate-binding protein [Candidatus Coatesbacteria bacterium]|nr:branched-chain amino acid ABC transporter substrate-binding protein [Candidatus Coatesbacteria bacterium]
MWLLRNIICFLVLFSLSCGHKTEVGHGDKTGEKIKIGVEGPLTGEYALEGQGFKKAIELLAEQLNAEGGILGKKVEIIIQDDRGDPQEASNAAAKLVDQKVIAVIGSYNSGASEPASKVYNEHNILHIIPSSTATRITTKGYKKLFRVCFLDDRQGSYIANFTATRLSARNIAIIHDNSTYAKGLADWTKKYLEELKAEIVFFDAIDPKGQDFKPLLTKMKEKKPDAIIFTGYYGQAGLLVKQTRDLGIKAPFISGNAVNNPEYVKIAGLESAKGSFIITEPLPQDLDNPGAKKLVTDFKAKYGHEPQSVWTMMAADAFNILIKAIKETKSTDPSILADYLHKLKDYQGVTGTIQGFDEKGDRLGSVHVAYIVDETGKFLLYKEKKDTDDKKEVTVEVKTKEPDVNPAKK